MALKIKWVDDRIEEWRDMEPKFRYLLVGIVVVGVSFILYQRYLHAQPDLGAASSGGGVPPSVAAQVSSTLPTTSDMGTTPKFSGVPDGILPSSPRNQGLEDLATQIARVNHRMDELEHRPKYSPTESGSQATSTPKVTPPYKASSQPNDGANGVLGKDLPEAVSFDQPASGAFPTSLGKDLPTAPVTLPSPPPEPRPALVVDESQADPADSPTHRPDLVLPMYSGIQAIMLSGINARQSSANGHGAAGSVTSAVDVGAPFVSRVKGLAIMPNSWRARDLENCFIGGSATAVLSAERAYGIADHISCVFKNGDIYEAPIQAYALDVDGTLGLAGKVVNKQGAMLLQAALTGMAAGLGSALSPTAVSSYNTNAGAGSTQSYTYPSPSFLAGTTVGQGIHTAATELSQFYLNFAKETFPVVEVTAGTRVTWILKKDIVLKRVTKQQENEKDNA